VRGTILGGRYANDGEREESDGRERREEEKFWRRAEGRAEWKSMPSQEFEMARTAWKEQK
jgi:hypothetical protein